jgi:hypothetical protein
MNGEEKIKLGLMGIGLDTYWAQFKGLKERLEGYQRFIAEKLGAFGCEVADAGLVDNPDKARRVPIPSLRPPTAEPKFFWAPRLSLNLPISAIGRACIN